MMKNESTTSIDVPESAKFPRRRRQPIPEENQAATEPVNPVSKPISPVRRSHRPRHEAGKPPALVGDSIAASSVLDLESDVLPISPLAEKDKKALENSTGKTIVRVFLVLLIIMVLGFMVYINIMEPEQTPAPTLAAMPKISETIIDDEGNALATDLYRTLLRGEYKSVLSQANSLRARKPSNARIFEQIFLAEAVAAAIEADAALKALPKSISTGNATLTLEERMARHQRRLQPLSILAGLRIDWGERLLGIPSIRDIYNQNDEEVDTAIVRLERWREAQTALTEAAEALESVPMNYQRGQSLLLLAGDMLDEDNLHRLGHNIGSLQAAQEALELSDIKEAYLQLQKIEWSEEDIDPQSQAYEHRIEFAVRKAVAEREAQIKQWRLLYESGERAKESYGQGKHEAAVEILAGSLAEIEPDSSAAERLAADLRVELGHYLKIRDSWNVCITQMEKENFERQLSAFADFALLTTDEERDIWQIAECERRLDAIKAAMRENIIVKSKVIEEVRLSYTGIDGKLRNPESPRREFSVQALPLRDMTRVCEEIVAVRDLVPNWEMGEDVDEILKSVHLIIADYAEQTQRLFNMGKLYRNRGGLEQSRECFARVIELDELKNNLFFAEATVMMDDRAAQEKVDEDDE